MARSVGNRLAAGALLLGGALGALAGPGVASAQSGKGEYVGAWSAGAALGYAVPTTDEYGNALAWRVFAGYSPWPQLELGVELGRFSTKVRQPEANGVPTHTVASGEIEVRQLGLTAAYRRPLPDLFSTLVLEAGVGYYFLDYEMGAEQRAIFEAGGVRGLPDQAVDDTWGLHAGAGVEYAVTETVSVVGGVRYLLLAPGASGTAAPGRSIDGDLDLDTWLFSAGVKYGF